MAKWKSTMDAQKERHKGRSSSTTKPESDISENEFVKLQAQKIIDIIAKDQEPPSSILINSKQISTSLRNNTKYYAKREKEKDQRKRKNSRKR